MAKYEIKIEATGAQQSAQSLSKLAKITDDVAKNIAAMDKAEQATLKTQRVFGDQSAQMANHLSQLTKEAKATGTATDGLSKTKSRLLDGVKKLGVQIPILGAALGALKNPYTAIAAVAGLALDAVRRLNEDIEKFAEASSKFDRLGESGKTLGNIMREAAGRTLEFEDALRKLQNRSETVDEKLARMKGGVARAFGIEEELAPKDESPEAKRNRRQRRIAAEAEAVGNARIQAGNELRDAQAALPGATQQRLAAESGLNRFQKLNAANEEAIGTFGGRQKLVARIAELTPHAEQGNQSAKLQLTLAQDALASYDRTRGAVQPRLERAQTRFNLASTEEERLKGIITSSAEKQRSLRIEAGELDADFTAQRRAFGAGTVGPNVGGIGRGSVQFRADAQIAAGGERIKDFELQQVTQALGRLSNAILKMANDTERKMKTTSQTIQ